MQEEEEDARTPTIIAGEPFSLHTLFANQAEVEPTVLQPIMRRTSTKDMPTWLIGGRFYYPRPTVFSIRISHEDDEEDKYYNFGHLEDCLCGMDVFRFDLEKPLTQTNLSMSFANFPPLSSSASSLHVAKIDSQKKSEIVMQYALKNYGSEILSQIKKDKGLFGPLVCGKFSMNSVQRKSFIQSVKSLFTSKSSIGMELNPNIVRVASRLECVFPLGTYRGVQGKMVMTQKGSKNLLEIDSFSLNARHLFQYQEMCSKFCGFPMKEFILDPCRKCLINVLCDPISKYQAVYRVIMLSVDSSAAPNVFAVFTGPNRDYVFAVTSHAIVVIFFPLKLNYSSSNLLSSCEFKKDLDTQFYVISRRGYLSAIYRSEPCLALHTTIKYEHFDEKTIVIDMCVYNNHEILMHQNLSNLNSASPKPIPIGTVRRFYLYEVEIEFARFIGAAGMLPAFPFASFEIVYSSSLELSCINQQHCGLPYRFAYGLSVMLEEIGKASWFNCIHKIDFEAEKTLTFSEIHCIFLQAKFVHSINDCQEEDDGLVLCLMTSLLFKKSYLVILDAKDMVEMRRYELPSLLAPNMNQSTWCHPKPRLF